ncbi:MAG: hypothetical protein WBQ45_00050 [Roseiarcus sp.]|uniref:hypothetical protein n=1 Tax=Roseiarcus sp. TaxID=1969460 RepID=UPI003BB0E66C
MSAAKRFQRVRRQKLSLFSPPPVSGWGVKELKAHRKEMKAKRKEMKAQHKETKVLRKEMKI